MPPDSSVKVLSFYCAVLAVSLSLDDTGFIIDHQIPPDIEVSETSRQANTKTITEIHTGGSSASNALLPPVYKPIYCSTKYAL